MTIAQTRPGHGCGPEDQSRSDDLEWLDEVLGFLDGPATIEYLGRPTAANLHLLVPTRPRVVATTALRRFDADRSPAKLAAGYVGRLAARFGLLGHAPGVIVTLPPFELVEQLAGALGEPKLIASVTLGGRRRNRKPVLRLLTPSGRVVGFAKVGWSPLTTALVANEGDVLQLVEGQLPAFIEAPRVILRQPWRSGEVVVTSPLAAGSIVDRTRARARAPKPVDIALAIAAVDSTPIRPMVELDLVDQWRIAGLHEQVDLDTVTDRHGETALATGLWHGDLTPWNLLAKGSSVAVWDWEFGGRGRPVGFDALHHLFESVRRSDDGTHRAALEATITQAAEILAPFGPIDGRAVDATVDLWICELIARELRLDGQRWSGDQMAGLAGVAVELLEPRLR